MNKNEYGYFNPNDNNIYLNSKFLKKKHCKFSYHAIDTVIHEGRHSYQDDIVNDRIINSNNEPKKLWSMNKIAYFNSSKNYSLYRFQPIEVDSNNYASKETNKLHKNLENKLGKDKYFKQYDSDIKYNSKLDKKEAIKTYGNDYIKVISNEMKTMYNGMKKNKFITKDKRIVGKRISLDERVNQIKDKINSDFTKNKSLEKLKSNTTKSNNKIIR